MKTIFLLMDSLNRHYLNSYGFDKVKTPNIDRLASRGIVFDSHYAGSLPCMPARRELMTGRLNFLETPWGPVEPWDTCMPVELREQKGTYCHMVTDHYHYFHSGGEAYHTLFDSWELERGQQGDRWHPLVKEPEVPEFKGKNRRAYWVNREFYDREDETQYPTPRCFMRGMEFLENNCREDNWHLHLEVFDPHEPFVCPKKYTDLYGDQWEGEYHFDWPPYQETEEGPEAIEHIRRSYAGVLTMADVWLGKFLDKMDELDLWKDTAVIFTTDHGHLLGEHGYWGKNYMFDYQELAHIPLIICTPETAYCHRRVPALTATMDLMPTIMELHGAQIPPDVHGSSLLPLLDGSEERLRDSVLYGYFGKDINLFDGRYSYCRQPAEGSKLYHHTLMPRSFNDFLSPEQLTKAELGFYIENQKAIPQLRIEAESYRHKNAGESNLIYDIQMDPGQEHPIVDSELENKLAEKMVRLLIKYDAPECQYQRTGLEHLRSLGFSVP